MQNKVVVAVLGWIMVTIIVAIALFVAFSFLLIFASFVAWNNIFTVDVTYTILRLSALIGGVLAAAMMIYDWNGFYEAWGDLTDGEDD